MNLKIKDGLIIGGIFTALIGFGLYLNIKHFDELSKFGEHTQATILSCRYRSEGRYTITFRYYVEDKAYLGSDSVSFFRCADEDNNNKCCIGKIFTLTYSSRDPLIYEIDLEKYNHVKGYRPH